MVPVSSRGTLKFILNEGPSAARAGVDRAVFNPNINKNSITKRDKNLNFNIFFILLLPQRWRKSAGFLPFFLLIQSSFDYSVENLYRAGQA